MENILSISNLSKSFKEKKALDDLSFSVKKGQLFGFLGLNGAGKSTTLNIILGLIKRDSGEVLIEGESIDKEIRKIRNKIGVVFQQSILDPELSVYENLYVRAALYKDVLKDKNVKEAVSNIISKFNLHDIQKQRYSTLSGGQKRRVDIARALIHNPSILFLDEPTTGLDPSSRKLVWKILSDIQSENKLTILLTTHYMEEANNCDYAVIIQNGKKIVEGTPAELKSRYSKTTVVCFKNSHKDFEKELTKKHFEFKNYGNKIEIFFNDFQSAKEFVSKYNSYLEDYELLKGNMDTVFLNVTKGGNNETN
ncbi:ABC transporter ATP-binding protein [Mycoplasma sp. Mirounga ES2805-ORL]|uniref:ABC transporter ATP-binding protein n=1 Tax=Mycoplasma sp. Mirounga ES2805-ORL TaxID=754514 RepID=UPI00197B4790|nr:ABC transporter ATP-binding protein [Mycoplasma sp. Mirounga ES2805-ORL]QSF13400.1 ABC transporter ATP-binding protein [Mycoplasma sp. Mirounga ES2805-ORL]